MSSCRAAAAQQLGSAHIHTCPKLDTRGDERPRRAYIHSIRCAACTPELSLSGCHNSQLQQPPFALRQPALLLLAASKHRPKLPLLP